MRCSACVCGRGGSQRWHAAFSTKEPSGTQPVVAISIINVCVLYFDGGFYACRTERLMAHLRLLLYSLRKKNGVWRKCEVSETLLMHTLWSGEPQLAGVCGHYETHARFKWHSYILICWNNILWSIYGIRLALWCVICRQDRPARFAPPLPNDSFSKDFSSIWCQNDYSVAPDRFRASTISICKYQTCLIWSHAFSGSPTIANEQEQAGKLTN